MSAKQRINPLEFDPDQLQCDTQHPLHSDIEDFAQLGLCPELLEGVYAMHFKRPSRIQGEALPIILNTSDSLVGQSQSGTGKTATFGLGCLQKVDCSIPVTEPQALILEPTRELVLQTTSEVVALGKVLIKERGLTVDSVIPGCGFSNNDPFKQVQGHIIVGTAGTIVQLLRKRRGDPAPRFEQRSLKMFVLDEADELTEGQGAKTLEVFRAIDHPVQVLLFSATFLRGVERICRVLCPDCRHILRIKEVKNLNVASVRHFWLDFPSTAEKIEYLMAIHAFCEFNQTIVFVNSKEMARRLDKRFQEEGLRTGVIFRDEEDRDGTKRDQTLEEYRRGETKVLIATNVLARGVDVVSTSVVINFDIPCKASYGETVEVSHEIYLHRVGRCGRFGRPGVALNLLHTIEDVKGLKAIAEFLRFPIDGLPSDPSLLPDILEQIFCVDYLPTEVKLLDHPADHSTAKTPCDDQQHDDHHKLEDDKQEDNQDDKQEDKQDDKQEDNQDDKQEDNQEDKQDDKQDDKQEDKQEDTQDDADQQRADKGSDNDVQQGKQRDGEDAEDEGQHEEKQEASGAEDEEQTADPLMPTLDPSD